ncbi:cell division protein GTPase/tubulin-like protein FtsZ [Psychroflexus torquis ATCC 700755]|uniref:Cell division protein FtsZ n=1 Tax=Psychroflexus torquis (strain ATCC 700755 / CIP 106069 / ACAM 623) TaxID=313595 RepID=K4IH19_PSYTT|nr:cell division protein FtsZ [Psychroflexus torquis]AFU69827.1 cell division protein GTPase/tubulin-like protein FtsZ [Psychroflexus torquis ATCC 700755]
MSKPEFENISFDLPKNQSNVIKVIGVGGGGSNAINHMFSQGIKGVDFVVCNTDSQALDNSPVPTKIQLGVNLTEGLGAGANPDIGKQAAEESREDLKGLLSSNTKMVFITAGMGGGTGTGAAPVIARLAKEMDILTVGIVTIPFQFEGRTRNEQAQLGVEELRSNVDSLIVINNNKLREVYGNLGFKSGFSKADEVLATASRGIAEVITHHYTQNIDLRDAKTVLSNSGTAIMGSAEASGANRSQIAIEKALDSPLLNDNKIKGAKNVLLLIVSGTDEITLDEIGEINDHIQAEAGNSANIIMGVGDDPSLEDAISVTVIATGFDTEQQDEIVNTETKKIIHTLEDDQRIEQNLSTGRFKKKPLNAPQSRPTANRSESNIKKSKVAHELNSEDNKEEVDDNKNKVDVNNLDVDFEIVNANEEDLEILEEPNSEDDNTSEGMLNFDFSNDEDESPSGRSAKSSRDIEVNEAEEVKSYHEKTNRDIKKYDLSEFMKEEETYKPSSKPQKRNDVKNANESDEINFSKRTVSPSRSFEPKGDSDEVDPMNTSLSELASRAAERKAKMKQFNYKFRNTNNIDEIEKQPAYKRAGIELDNNQSQGKGLSRTSVEGNKDNLNFRSNNSFLHDNVD